MPVFAIAVISILFSVLAQIALKSGMSQPGIRAAMAPAVGGDSSTLRVLLAAAQEPMVWLGFALYGLGALIWLLVLAKWDLSKAYPLVGMGFLLTMASSALMLGERLAWDRVLGTLLVLAGVLLVVRS
jgi:drug/metabolite transporter (DMT)-like permease